MTAVDGVDVADWQGEAYKLEVDTKTKAYFVIIKATEGTTYTNPKLRAQLEFARKEKKIVGFYHFLHKGDVWAQISHFKAVIKAAGYKPGDILAIDWEGYKESGKDVWAPESDKNAALGILHTDMPESQNLLYCNLDFWHNKDKTNNCGDGLWIADPNNSATHPGVTHPWKIHQYMVHGNEDWNVANYNNVPDFLKWVMAKVRTTGGTHIEPIPSQPVIVNPPGTTKPIPPVTVDQLALKLVALTNRVSTLEKKIGLT